MRELSHIYSSSDLTALLLSGAVLYILTAATILWCTLSATHMFVAPPLNMSEQYALIAYPSFLLYMTFALITIF